MLPPPLSALASAPWRHATSHFLLHPFPTGSNCLTCPTPLTSAPAALPPPHSDLRSPTPYMPAPRLPWLPARHRPHVAAVALPRPHRCAARGAARPLAPPCARAPRAPCARE
eukprot:261386-Chlamydomonas_euryale.AAC.8